MPFLTIYDDDNEVQIARIRTVLPRVGDVLKVEDKIYLVDEIVFKIEEEDCMAGVTHSLEDIVVNVHEIRRM